MKNNPMKDALKMRRGNGLDISILINPQESENEELGLAPDAPPLDDEQSGLENEPNHEQMAIQELLASGAFGKMLTRR